MNIDEIRMIISQGIQHWMRKKNLTIKELAYNLHCSQEYIRKLIAGEHVRIELDFLQDLVAVLGRKSYRIRGYEETEDTYPFDECVKLLKQPPPQQPKLFDDD